LTLIDTSAWVEFLRGTGSPVCDEVDGLVASGGAITYPIMMEVLVGARDQSHLRQLRGLLARTRMLRCEPVDYMRAALLYRTCRRGGETVRRLTDCLIAAVAIRHQTPLLCRDTDFTILARWTTLILSDASS
jgi:predicted nucleic acid-binding protein